jgi:hypothetical protein
MKHHRLIYLLLLLISENVWADKHSSNWFFRGAYGIADTSDLITRSDVVNTVNPFFFNNLDLQDIEITNREFTSDKEDTAISISFGYSFPEFSLAMTFTQGGKYNANFLREFTYNSGVENGQSSTSAELDNKYIEISIFRDFYLAKNFFITPEIGVAFWKSNVDVNIVQTRTDGGSDNVFDLSGSDDGVDINYGIGLGVNLSSNVSIILNWKSFEVDGGSESVISLNARMYFLNK